MLQELEWHFHTGLFALVLGYGYIWNTHVRVDLIREHLHFRKKAWLELLGLLLFLIPYTCIVVYFAFVYAYDAYVNNEISVSTGGPDPPVDSSSRSWWWGCASSSSRGCRCCFR